MLYGLMKPPVTSYHTNWDMSIHLNQAPAEREKSP